MKSTWNSRQGWTLNEVSDEEFLAFTMLLNSYRKREGVSLVKHVATMIARETVEEAMNYVTLNQGGQEHDGRDAKV